MGIFVNLSFMLTKVPWIENIIAGSCVMQSFQQNCTKTVQNFINNFTVTFIKLNKTRQSPWKIQHNFVKQGNTIFSLRSVFKSVTYNNASFLGSFVAGLRIKNMTLRSEVPWPLATATWRRRQNICNFSLRIWIMRGNISCIYLRRSSNYTLVDSVFWRYGRDMNLRMSQINVCVLDW